MWVACKTDHPVGLHRFIHFISVWKVSIQSSSVQLRKKKQKRTDPNPNHIWWMNDVDERKEMICWNSRYLPTCAPFFTPSLFFSSLERCIAFKCRISDVLTCNSLCCWMDVWIDVQCNSQQQWHKTVTYNKFRWFNLHMFAAGYAPSFQFSSDSDSHSDFRCLPEIYNYDSVCIGNYVNGMGCECKWYASNASTQSIRLGFDWGVSLQSDCTCWWDFLRF